MLHLWIMVSGDNKAMICSDAAGIDRLGKERPDARFYRIGAADRKVPPGYVATISAVGGIAWHNITYEGGGGDQ